MNNGYSYFGARYYDIDLSVWLSVDPLSDMYPSTSPFMYVLGNPIRFIDENGLKHKDPMEDPNETRIEHKFNRKFRRFKKNNNITINKGQSREVAEYEAFKISINFWGRYRCETRWFRKYEKNEESSTSTWWTRTSTVQNNIIQIGNASGNASLRRQINIGVSQGTMQINYDMYGAKDRLQVFNTATGELLFDTANLEASDRFGRVKNKDGSGALITYNLGEGNTNITILVNGQRPQNGSVFDIKIIPNIDKINNQSVETH